MTPLERQRLSLLGLLLTATLAVAAVSGLEKDGEGAVESRDSSGSTAGRSGESLDALPRQFAKLDLSQIRREAEETVAVDIFMAKSWQPLPPPPAAPQIAAPVIPTAPPLPFKYEGQLGDPQTGKIIVYLSRGDLLYTITTGEMAGEQYRLEAINERQLTFVYLPLKTQQILAIPGN